MMSVDKVQGNVEKIRALFPNAVTEVLKDGKPTLAVDFDVLKQELADTLIDDRELRYQFTWPDKQKSILLANTPVDKTLRPCKEESVDFDNTQNLYIEGDNLEVLKLLQETYLGKIKMIYIDPPYNTGNDFVYNDDFSQNAGEYLEGSGQFDEQGNRLFQNTESNGRFHTDWLNMIYPRLRLAKDLLSDDGVIFISIDDNELSNCMKECEEIFGNANFIGLFSVEVNPKGRKNSKFISVSNDYCLVYAKNIDASYFVENIPKNIQDLAMDDDGNYVHNSGKRVLVGENKFNRIVTNFSSDKHYSVYYNREKEDIQIRKETLLDEIDGILLSNNYERYYSFYEGKFVENTYTMDKLKELFMLKRLDFKNGKIYEKNLSTTIRIKSLLVNKAYQAVVNGQVVDFAMDFKTTSAGTELKELFNSKDVLFSAPKNWHFIKLMVSLLNETDFTILDFFSGSATTAHAVMQLNAEDGGNRKFIMVQLPEPCDEKSEAYKAGYKNICEIGKERIRRAGVKIKQEQGLKAQNLDIGFRVLKLDTSNMQPVYYNPEEYSQTLLDDLTDNIKADRTPLDLLFQVMLDLGKPLSAKIEEKDIAGKHVFIVNDDDLIACFDSNVTEETVKAIAQLKPLYAVFRDSSLANDSTAANFDQIFATYSPNTVRKVL